MMTLQQEFNNCTVKKSLGISIDPMTPSPTYYPTSAPTQFTFTDSQVESAIVIFVLLGVGLGNLTEYIVHNFSSPIPYHVLVFVQGLLISVCLNFIVDVGGSFERVICTENVSSDLIIFIFLPVLLFGETMNLNWHHVSSGFKQYAVLAGPGALFSACITAVVMYFFLPYSWSWRGCFLFGAVLSATDPVSIIALLKSTGASSKLTTIIVGESLFNDGSAMILFLLFYKQSQYMASAASFITFVIEMLIVSPAIGITMGLIAHKLMLYFHHPLNPHMDVQIGITLICAYLSFYIAEGPCGISGVLSCCTAGLMLAWVGSPKILDDHKMHEIWGTLEWLCNTLIFFLAGLIAGAKSWSRDSGSVAVYFGYLLAVYVIVMTIRVIMIVTFYPLLKNMGLKCTRNEAIFMSYSGLRGALGISLALVVQSNNASFENFFFLFAGVASLSLLINGSTAKILLLYLQLIENPEAQKSDEMILVLNQIRQSIRSRVMTELEEMEDELGNYNSSEVDRLCRLMRGSFEFDLGFSLEGKNRMVIIHRESTDSSRISRDLLAYVRTTFLDTVRSRYWDSIRTGKLGNHAFSAKLLLYSIDVALDSVNDPSVGMMDWDCIERSLHIDPWLLKIGSIIDNLAAVVNYYPGWVSYLEAKKERAAIYTLTNFIDAHQFAQGKLHEYLGAAKNGQSAANPEEAMVRKDSFLSVERAKKLLSIFPAQDIQGFYTSRAARIVILKQKNIVQEMLEAGALSEKSAYLIYKTIEHDDMKVTLERESQHKAFLKATTQRKIEEEKEYRQSLRQSLTSNPLLVNNGGTTDGNGGGSGSIPIGGNGGGGGGNGENGEDNSSQSLGKSLRDSITHRNSLRMSLLEESSRSLNRPSNIMMASRGTAATTATTATMPPGNLNTSSNGTEGVDEFIDV